MGSLWQYILLKLFHTRVLYLYFTQRFTTWIWSQALATMRTDPIEIWLGKSHQRSEKPRWLPFFFFLISSAIAYIYWLTNKQIKVIYTIAKYHLWLLIVVVDVWNQHIAEHCMLNWIRRECNFVAYSLAKFSLDLSASLDRDYCTSTFSISPFPSSFFLFFFNAWTVKSHGFIVHKTIITVHTL